jgi:hypothetical protein
MKPPRDFFLSSPAKTPNRMNNMTNMTIIQRLNIILGASTHMQTLSNTLAKPEIRPHLRPGLEVGFI